ncbi:MAG: glycoside hydrolase family 30 beta sandwich domain-containing protein [Paludibacter sp.]|nr:glycoside hydrolase family 30 beta sandwich domain-containing protein [Paludibacter sp.]
MKFVFQSFRSKQLMLLLCFFLTFQTFSQTVTPWMTSSDKSRLLTQQTTTNFATNTGTANITVTLKPTATYQTMDGFGFALTEGSAEVISSLTSVQQNNLLTELFDKTNGLGISVLRISIGASDLSSSDYSYDEVSGDTGLTSFSMAGPDLTYLVPILKKILKINPDVKILATPWTAPRWMKTNKAWIGGKLSSTYYETYSKYFVAYLNAMKNQGINLWAITVQNEPENGTAEPSMLMTYAEQISFINNNLGPELAGSGFSAVKIIAYDHNCGNTTYPIAVCNNSSYVDGAAFHLYSGDISALTTVKNATGKNVYFTEQYTASTGSFSGDFAWHFQNVLFGASLNWAKVILEWNLANNSSIGPHTPGGCNTCQGAVTVNNSTSYNYNLSYYLIGQFSKFVKPDAIRIGTTTAGTNVLSTAFQNTDGTIVTLVYNTKSSSQTIKIVSGTQSFIYTLPAATVASFVWQTDPNGLTQLTNSDLFLYPNPAKNIIKIKNNISGKTVKSIAFITMTGKIVLQKLINGTAPETTIKISNLPAGVYIAKIICESSSLYQCVIKQ